jgi:hypothetical protein
MLASPGAGDVSVLPGWVAGLKAKEASCSLDAVVEAEIRNSSRPGSQAPHAPPALTFGLPGKQRVKPGEAGCVLTRYVSSLRENRINFINGTTAITPNPDRWVGSDRRFTSAPAARRGQKG